MQVKRNGPGRPPVFNWLRIVAVIIMTLYLFDAVWYAKVLIDLLNINVTLNYRSRRFSRSPSVDEIYKIYQKIPESYLYAILLTLDEWARKRALKNLGLVCDICFFDSSAESEHTKEEALIAGKTRLRTSKLDYTVAVRFFTNTVISVIPGTPKNINEYYELLRRVGINTVVVDGYFRTYMNLEMAAEYGICFITRSKKGSRVWRYNKRYGMRKLVEILFGDLWMRSKRRLFGRGRASRYKKLLLRLIGHNFRAYERVVALERLFVRVSILEEAYLSI